MEAPDPALIERPRRAVAWRTSDLLALAPSLALLTLLFGGALLGAAKVSLIPLGGGLGDASLEQWGATLSDPAFLDSVLFTLRIALVSTVIAAAAGVGLAFALRHQGGVFGRFPPYRCRCRTCSSPSSRWSGSPRVGLPTESSGDCRSTSCATVTGSA